MWLVDSHCHLDMLDLTPWNGDLEAALDAARARDIGHFLCINVDPAKLDHLRAITAGREDVSLSVGLHPLHEPEVPLTLEHLVTLASADDIVAVGETGLDYHYSPDTHEVQKRYFEMHLEAALQVNKPVIVHTRDARADTLDMLRRFTERGGQGVLHCFTEDLNMAREAIEMGFYISLSGIVTFKSAAELQAVAKALPLDRLLVETDSPYLAPVPHRGKKNEPQYVREVAAFLAELRGDDPDFLAHQTTENFFTLFTGARGAMKEMMTAC